MVDRDRVDGDAGRKTIAIDRCPVRAEVGTAPDVGLGRIRCNRSDVDDVAIGRVERNRTERVVVIGQRAGGGNPGNATVSTQIHPARVGDDTHDRIAVGRCAAGFGHAHPTDFKTAGRKARCAKRDPRAGVIRGSVDLGLDEGVERIAGCIARPWHDGAFEWSLIATTFSDARTATCECGASVRTLLYFQVLDRTDHAVGVGGIDIATETIAAKHLIEDAGIGLAQARAVVLQADQHTFAIVGAGTDVVYQMSSDAFIQSTGECRPIIRGPEDATI